MRASALPLRVLLVAALLSALGPLGSAAELTAGDVDDNLNFEAYSNWAGRLRENRTSLPTLNLTERVTVRVVDAAGSPVSRALVSVTVAGESQARAPLPAGTDGVLRFFPGIDAKGPARQFTLQASAPGGGAASSSVSLDLDAPPANRTLTLSLGGQGAAAPQALDLMIVLDTTGSMSDELQYLKSQLGAIVGNVTRDHPAVDIRFGLVVYRDVGDIYVVRSFPFTSSLQSIQDDLDAQVAYDGGDFPEAMDVAIGEAVGASWRSGNTARVALVVADAPPHEANFTATFERILEARAAGIQLYALAASGVDPTAEYILRAGAALTGARYMFLTDDSKVGNSHAEPHVLCYQVTVLSNLISRVISSELEGQRVEASPEAVLRTVGNVTGGVCVDASSGDQPPVSPTLPAATSPPPKSSPGVVVPATAATEPTVGVDEPSTPGVVVADGTSTATTDFSTSATWFAPATTSLTSRDFDASHLPSLASSPAPSSETSILAGSNLETAPPLASPAASSRYAATVVIGLLFLALGLASATSAVLWRTRSPVVAGSPPSTAKSEPAGPVETPQTKPRLP